MDGEPVSVFGYAPFLIPCSTGKPRPSSVRLDRILTAIIRFLRRPTRRTPRATAIRRGSVRSPTARRARSDVSMLPWTSFTSFHLQCGGSGETFSCCPSLRWDARRKRTKRPYASARRFGCTTLSATGYHVSGSISDAAAGKAPSVRRARDVRHTGSGRVASSPFCVSRPRPRGRTQAGGTKTAIHPMPRIAVFFLFLGAYPREPRRCRNGAGCLARPAKRRKGGTSLSELPASLCRTALAGLRFTAVFVPKSRLQASDRRRRPWRPSESRPPDTRLSNIRFLSAKKKKYSSSKAQTILPLELMVGIEPTTC